MHRPGWLAFAYLCAATPLAGQLPAVRPDVTLPADTVLTDATHWPLRIQTAGTTLVTVFLAPVAPDRPPLHVESRLVRRDETFWPLHGRDGAPLASGIYRLHVVAQDSATGQEAGRVRVIAVERAETDTEPHPPALDRSAFLPESTTVTSHRPGFLLIAGIGVASLATAVTFEEGSISPITIVIPGALALGGLIGFLRGRTVTEVVPENAAHNRQLVKADIAARQAIASANAQTRAGATLRIRVVDQP